jgi:hypothetical protein
MISCVSGSWGRNPKKKEKRKEQRGKAVMVGLTTATY